MAGALLPLVLLIVGIVFAGYRADRERAAQQVQAVARGTALAVERELRATIASLEALALSPSLAGGDLTAFRQEADTLAKRHFPGASIALLTPDGEQIFNTFRPPGTPLPRRPNLEALQRVVATGLPAVSDVFEATLQRVPIVPVDVPVRGADGGVSAILSLAPPLDTFAEVIRQQRADAAWVIAILDRKGTIVARAPNPGRFVGQPAAADIRSFVQQAPEGTAETTSLEGVPLLAGWSRPGPSGWGVAIGIPRAMLYATHWQTLSTTLGLSFLALIGALALARVVAGRIAKPVHALVTLAAYGPVSGRAAGTTLGLQEADAVAAALATATGERAVAEARLRQVQARGQAELEHLVKERTQELHTAQARLLQAQRMEAVGQLTAGIAHDFNNLLQAQMAGLELLLDTVKGQGEATRYAEMALGVSESGAKLTHSLLAFSRQQVLRPEAVRLPALLDALHALLSRTLDPRITLRMDVEAGLAAPLADPAQLEAALLNLCLNGRDAMRDQGGRLLVEAYAGTASSDAPSGVDQENCIVLAVSDEGHGMDAETLARACEPFFTTKGVGKGSGLGLSMVQGFARQSGGELRVESWPGAGTRIEIWLPRASAPAVGAASRSRLEAAAARMAPASGRVLLVDDEPGVRDLIGELLEGAGFVVTTARNGEDALALLRAGSPVDVMVTDYAMPGLTGGELVREARRLRPDLPTLVITGYADDFQRGQVPAGVDVLHKPFRVEELASRIAGLAAETRRAVH